MVAIVGKSGSGKSTLLHILGTLDTADQGNVEICGTKIAGLSPRKLASFRSDYLGFVFQFHFLLPEFTVLKNVMLPALKLGKHPAEVIEEKAMEKLRMVGMDMYASKLASRLSGGQQQRVAIARALINDPAIIMGDEPTGNLDSTTGAKIIDLLFELNRLQGTTLVLITHEQRLASLCQKHIELSAGAIVSREV